MKISQRIQALGGAFKSFFGSPAYGDIVFQKGQPRLLGSTESQLDSNSIIQACLVSILGAFTGAQFVSAEIGDTGDDVFDHASVFAKLMRRPDEAQNLSGRRLMKAMLASYVLDGNAYAKVEVDKAGDAIALHYVPHWSCEPKAGKKGLLDGYELTYSDGSRELVKPEYIIHLADGIDPRNQLKGRSAVKSVLLQVMTDSEADVYSSEIINNPAIVGWALIPKYNKDGKGPGKDNAEYAEARINERYGRGGRGGVMVPGFEADIKVVGFSPEQLVLDKLRKVPEARISAVMDVPAIIAGLQVGLERSTFSNTEEARKYFIRYRISPLWETFAEEFTEQLLERCQPKDNERCAFDTRKVQELQEPVKDKWERVETAWTAGLIKRSEGRQIIGLDFDSADEVYFQDQVIADQIPNAKTLKARMQQRRRVHEALDIQDEDEGAA